MSSELIPITDRQSWQQALNGLPHALAHTWEYNHALSLRESSAGGGIILWHFSSSGCRAVCPLLVRSYGGQRDVITPYGFSGFAADSDETDFLAALREQAAREGWVCGYLGLHPVLDKRIYAADELHAASNIYALDLRQSEAGLYAAMSSNIHQKLTAWERSAAGLSFNQSECRSFFMREYRPFIRRVGAAAGYDFPPAVLAALCEHPGILMIGGGALELEAVSVFGWTRDCGEYLFNVSTESGRRHSARLIWEGMRELKRRGVPVLNLGGGIRPGDGLAQFKARFGGFSLPLRALKQVYANTDFERLCLATGADAGVREGWFPPYRSPRLVSRTGV